MNLNVRTKLKVDFPKLNFDRELDYISKRYIINDIKAYIELSRDLDGHPYEITAEKRRTGKKPLINKGILIDSFKAHPRGKNTRLIRIQSPRTKVGYRLQVEGVGKKRKKFKFFGISEITERRIIDFMIERLKFKVRNAR